MPTSFASAYAVQMAPLFASLTLQKSSSISARLLTPHLRTSDADVHKRIKAATSAFGAFKNALTSLSVELRVKGRIYNALVLSIKAFSSMVAKPGDCEKTSSIDCAHSTIVVYAQCAASQWPTRSNTASHLRACSSDRRLLRWAGHVARMPMDRMPRKLLTG
jgi:hypothetical protein